MPRCRKFINCDFMFLLALYSCDYILLFSNSTTFCPSLSAALILFYCAVLTFIYCHRTSLPGLLIRFLTIDNLYIASYSSMQKSLQTSCNHLYKILQTKEKCKAHSWTKRCHPRWEDEEVPAVWEVKSAAKWEEER